MTQLSNKLASCIVALSIGTWAASTPSLLTAEIYKTRDEQGNVTFSDVPTKDLSEIVKLSKTSQFPAPQSAHTSTPQSASRIDDDEGLETEATAYSSISISSPGPEEAIRENSGHITVTVRSEPRLSPGHTYTLTLDGQPAGDSLDGTFALENVDRGTHILSARIVNQNQSVITQSAEITFHMLRFSALSAKRRNAG